MALGQTWSKRDRKDAPADGYDVIVIGSGMGGMTTAATLAKTGKRVLVLEQHYVPGGFTHAFTRKKGKKKWEWDVGVHAVGEVTKRSMPGRILAGLTNDRLEWSSLGPVYDEFHFPDDFHIDFPDNPKQFRQNLVDAFPEEEEAIDEYLRLVREISGEMRAYYLARLAPKGFRRLSSMVVARKAQEYFEQTTKDALDKITRNEKLKAVLCSQWGYQGVTPSRSSLAMQALVTRHFWWGGYYPVGGSHRIAEELLGTVAEAGGWTRVSTSVEQILIEDGAVAGVKLDNGEEVRCKKVVSAVGVSATAERLLPEDYRPEWAREVSKLEPAPAHVCLYMGFEGDITKAGAGPANKWFYQSWDMELDAWRVDPEQEEFPIADCLYCSFPSLKDPLHDPGPDMLHTGEVVTFVPWSVFEPWAGTRWKKRGAEYDAFKKRLEETLLEQFLSHMPELRPMLAFAELGTPVSTDHFVRPRGGSIYGLEATPKRFRNRWLRPKSPVPGLFFSGSEVSAVGVIGAMMGGVLGAVAADPVGSVRVLSRYARARG